METRVDGEGDADDEEDCGPEYLNTEDIRVGKKAFVESIITKIDEFIDEVRYIGGSVKRNSDTSVVFCKSFHSYVISPPEIICLTYQMIEKNAMMSKRTTIIVKIPPMVGPRRTEMLLKTRSVAKRVVRMVPVTKPIAPDWRGLIPTTAPRPIATRARRPPPPKMAVSMTVGLVVVKAE